MTDDPTFSAAFAEMAARIEHNDPKDFAGAIVVVPPSGDAMAVLLLDGSRDVAAFWSMVQGRVAIVWKQLQQQETNQRLGGMLR